MAEYQISSCAYVKMLLHAAKYPHNAVNGVLLAEKVDKTWNVVDAIPLFHISLFLSPMAEIALVHVDELAAKRNLKVGWLKLKHKIRVMRRFNHSRLWDTTAPTRI